MSAPKKPTPGKSKISKKPAVEFEISDEDLDKASGGVPLTLPPTITQPGETRGGVGGNSDLCLPPPRR
jgi:hypothetical protein